MGSSSDASNPRPGLWTADSNDATAAAEAVPPPLAPPAADELPGNGGSTSPNAAAEAEAAADRKGKKVVLVATSPSPPSYTSSNSSLIFPVVSSAGSISPSRLAASVDPVSLGEDSSFASAAVDRHGKATVSWKEPIVEVPKEEARPIKMKKTFDTLLQDMLAIKQEAEQHQDRQARSLKFWRQTKDSLWSKVTCALISMDNILDREVKNEENRLLAGDEKVAGQHELRLLAGDEKVAGQHELLGSTSEISKSSKDNILDREVKHEENHLLAGDEKVAGQHEHLGSTSEISKSSKVLELSPPAFPLSFSSTPREERFVLLAQGFFIEDQSLVGTKNEAINSNVGQPVQRRIIESSDSITIEDVWEDDVDIAIKKLKKIVGRGCKLTAYLDTEFCMRGESGWRGEPKSLDAHYTQTKETVNHGNLVQVGLLLTDSKFEVLGNGCFQFNVKFNSNSRPIHHKTAAFLRQHLNLQEHALNGITVERLASLLRSSGLFSNANVTWVTFQACNDYGYLIKELEAVETLPEAREEFLRLVWSYFPSSYDLKVFHRLGICCKQSLRMGGGTDGLGGLADGLGVKQVDGKSHTSGWDAVLTMRCYQRMQLREPAAFKPMRRYQNILHGLMDPAEASYVRDTKEEAENIVHVSSQNFREQMKVLRGLFPLLGFIAVELVRSDEEGTRLEVVISDARGWIAFDKLWVFHVEKAAGGGGAEKLMSRAMLAELLTHAQAILSKSVVWISSRSDTFVYLVGILTAAPVPSEEDDMYRKLREAFFPSVCVVPESDGSRSGALATLRRFLRGGGGGGGG